MRNNKLKARTHFPRHYYTIAAVILVVGIKLTLAVIHQSSLNIFELLDHLLLIILVALLIHLLDHYLLWKDVIQTNQITLDKLMQEHESLLKSVNEGGITGIFPSRYEARSHVRQAIQTAKKRVWLLGVGLNVIIDLDKLITVLEDKKQVEGVDVRIMMLDAFRSTSVFRTFLESEPQYVQKMLTYYEKHDSDAVGKETYFSMRLCAKFEYICKRLEESEILSGAVKFYAHTPICWMVLVDDAAYFQPYTFGSLPQGQPHLSANELNSEEFTKPDMETIGDLMPVFRFKDESPSFNVLISHFKRLWSTSDEDLFNISARQANKYSLVRKIFAERMSWFKYVAGAIHSSRMPYEYEPNDSETEKYRKFTRKICPTAFEVSFTVSEHGTPLEKKALIYDYSRNGISLEVPSGVSSLSLGDKVIILSKGNGNNRNKDEQFPLASFILQKILGESNPYKIRHKTNNRIGLERVQHPPA